MSSGILECCTQEEVTVSNMGRFHRVYCVHCGCIGDYFLEDQDLDIDELCEGLSQHRECAACPGDIIIPLFSYCLHCPKYR